MIHFDDAALSYLTQLIAAQDIDGLAVRMRAINPGSATGDCRLEFCELEEISADDYVVEFKEFNVVIDKLSLPYLQQTEVSYHAQSSGGQLTIKAPRLKLQAPAENASLIDRVTYIIESEINPQVASHGGKVSLLEIDADLTAVLQFGGGCQGCGMKDVTLKQGVEKTLLSRVPELKGVRDATNHSAGENPYYKDQNALV